MLDKNSKIHIVGGTGAMGTWLRNFLNSLGYQSSVSDERIKPVDLETSDIVFISVPINISPKIITEISKKTHKECLIVDLSSIQSGTEIPLKESSRPAIAMHFLFGPSTHSIQNQKIIIQKFNPNKMTDDLLNLLKDQGAQLIMMGSKDHDFTVAHIQALTHFINLSLAEILIKDKIGVSGQISTPVFLSQISSTLRVLAQNPKLLSEIQILNPEFLKIVEEFVRIQEDLILKIKAKDIHKLEQQFSKLRKNLESVSGETKRKIKKISKEKIEVENLKIGYLGPRGTFSNEATLGLFNDKNNELLPSKNIYDLFESLDKNKVDLIVAPAENTIEGTVRETLDLLSDYNLKIIGKIDLPVSQCLLSKGSKLSEIKKIISHPQALNQSRKFLEENLPDALLETSPSTIASVDQLSDETIAIIGPELAGKIYNLNVLNRDIQNNKNNITRFDIIAKSDLLKIPNRTKTLLHLSVFDRVGVLRDVMSVFADLSINLNKIESRPTKEKHWDYYFYIEIEITDEDPRFIQALDILKQYCPQIIVLGKL